MKPLYLFIFIFVLIFSSCQKTEKVKKPNIIYILADDLGYGDVGVYGQTKIETPNIDALAKEGMLFTQHYSSAPVCAPARYMLLTGKHSGNAFIRGNDEWEERGAVWNYKAMARDSTLEGQRPIPGNTVTFAKKLQEKGYITSAFGKWGLGAPHTNAIPTKMGFDYFYGYNCQRQAHTYYPLHLYENEHRVHLKNDTVAPHTKLAKGTNPYNDNSYAPFNLAKYSPDLFFNKLTTFISKNKNTPFFVYWATPIPHVPLQAPKKWVNYYIKKFGEEIPYLGKKGYFPHKNPRAAYAAMISYLDENIGKLIRQLKKEGLYENTLIIFSSDNGPSTHGGVDTKWFNSGGGFGNDFGHTKGFVYEAGVRIPMIAVWKNHIQEGSISNHMSIQYDVFATLGEIVGFKTPKNTNGISFLPALLQKKQPKHKFLYWEFPEYNGQVAIRIGDWKVIRKNLHKKKEKRTLELYNLKKDPKELHNVANKHPEIIEQAKAIFKEEHTSPEIQKFKIKSIEKGLLGD